MSKSKAQGKFKYPGFKELWLFCHWILDITLIPACLPRGEDEGRQAGLKFAYLVT
jgi:hypothetical protein